MPDKLPRVEMEEAGQSATASQLAVGWALKVVNKSQRMDEKVKMFLTEKFNAGALSGDKADPTQVAKEMH